MTDAHPVSPRRSRRRGWLAATVATVSVATGIVGVADIGAAAGVANDDWLAIVNTYRAMSGLDPVTGNSTWSAEAAAHSCYMLQNGIAHDETPGRPGYTAGGDLAGNSGNVAVSSAVDATPRNHIDLWMTGPFHAIGVLRHNLTSSGFGLCAQSNTPTPWHSGGTLDVIRGIDNNRPRPSTPILFPGDGATVPLHSFIVESPNPMSLCGWTGSAGLPLIAMMPNDVTSATATITGPSGPIPTCTLHKGNTSADGTARAILDGDNAVVVMPRQVLADGEYTVSVDSNGGDVTWSFIVDRDAPLQATPPEPPKTPDTKPTAGTAEFEPVEPFRLVDSRQGRGTVKLKAKKTTRIEVADSDVVAVSANFVAVLPESNGYLTVYNCTDERPTVATLNFRAGRTVANQALVPLAKGDMCVYAHAATDLVVDVNGYYRADAGGSGFVPITPVRMLDSRQTTQLRAGKEFVLPVAGVAGGAPADARGVALNVTAILAKQGGHVKVYPCGAAAAGEISSLNYVAGEVRPNSAVVQVDDRGRICMRSLRNVDVTVDMTGYFSADVGHAYQPLDPIRVFDSRSPFPTLNESTSGARLQAGRELRIPIAGERGIPAGAKAASINIAATQPVAATYITAYPCGKRPATATLNVSPAQSTTANGAMVKLSSSGDLCVFALRDVHVIVDINGVWL